MEFPFDGMRAIYDAADSGRAVDIGTAWYGRS
jgi:hypothetical protein